MTLTEKLASKTQAEKIKAIDSSIESCFKILEQEINKKSELCDEQQLYDLARTIGFIIDAKEAFEESKQTL